MHRIICSMATGILLGTSGAISFGDTILTQPEDQSVCLHATAVFRVVASGGTETVYQWRKNGVELDGETGSQLLFAFAELGDAGEYSVVVSNQTGMATSRVAVLEIDSSFTQIRTGELVTEPDAYRTVVWGDFDNDGYPDVYIYGRDHIKHRLYLNQGDGTFLPTSVPAAAGIDAMGSACEDYDNDGHLDLFVPNYSWGVHDGLLHNLGDGTFERIFSGPGDAGIGMGGSCAWGDFDRDGHVDLLVSNGRAGVQQGVCALFRNQGGGAFARMGSSDVGPWIRLLDYWFCVTWVDYDQDGWQDLFLPIGYPSLKQSYLYQNLGDLVFTNVNSELACGTFAWADYDNDGLLDLFGGSLLDSGLNQLYHNEGGGQFRRMTSAEVGPVVEGTGMAGGAAWGDYDNDGDQDLVVARGWYYGNGYVQQPCLFYRNQGDGTFEQMTSGSVATQPSQALTANWVDYDLDGRLDLFISEYGREGALANRLYHNNAAGSHWLVVECVGTVSPRRGTGARVFATARIRQAPVRQLRLINSGGTTGGGSDRLAHFGLGDAQVVDSLRIEWPSGIVQELADVSVDQYLTVTEPPRLWMIDGNVVKVGCWPGMAFGIEASVDLATWALVGACSNTAGKAEFTDPGQNGSPIRFYRAVTDSAHMIRISGDREARHSRIPGA